jgi:ATP-binding cassette subfamily F protein uup
VKALIAMRDERRQRREQIGSVRLAVEQGESSGRLVFEAKAISKAFADRVVVRDFSTRIMRGDRIGLIGPNGSGKTTLLRMLLGEVVPDSGEVRRGANVQVAYYDQQREQLALDATVFDTIGEGNDTVTANGRTRHVKPLNDFLFSKGAPLAGGALSGGQTVCCWRDCLLGRRMCWCWTSRPRDLDLETLELLEVLANGPARCCGEPRSRFSR